MGDDEAAHDDEAKRPAVSDREKLPAARTGPRRKLDRIFHGTIIRPENRDLTLNVMLNVMTLNATRELGDDPQRGLLIVATLAEELRRR